MKTTLVLLLMCASVTLGLAQTGFVVDHTCTSFGSIPAAYLDSARSLLRIGLANTSHGHQLVVGMQALEGLPGFSFTRSGSGLLPGYFLNFVWSYPATGVGGINVNDLRYGDGGFTWATRYMLGLPGNDRNVVMWSWCWHTEYSTEAQVNAYLTGMDSLEKEYPSIRFVYMTGPLSGTGVSGNLNQRNEQIRAFCRANDKILYDFADIESYDPDGQTNYMVLNGATECTYSGGNWASQWIASHPNSQLATLAGACSECDHSEKLNCILKGGATWWLFARLAGWSGTGTVVAPPAPGVPAQLAPANNAAGQPLSTAIWWWSVTGATRYHLQVGTDSTFGSGVLVNDTTRTDTSYALSGLSNNQRYFWRVRSKNVSGSSAFSTVWNFRTAGDTPSAPILLAPPVNASELQISGVKLVWRSIPNAAVYALHVSTDSTFGSGIQKNDSTLTDTTYTVSGLDYSTLYFWRVAGFYDSGSGPFSPVGSFKTLLPVPGAVTLLSPAHLAVTGTDSVQFSWTNPSPSATGFWFELALDSMFTRFVVGGSTLMDTTKVVKSLASNTVYYWHVNGYTPTWSGPSSGVHKFTTSVTSVTSMEGVPAEITLRQNYPNPFNPTTEISYGIPKESLVRVEVYNLLGQKVATVVDGFRSAGFHSVRFDAKDLTTGTYLCRITAGETSVFSKMLLLK